MIAGRNEGFADGFSEGLVSGKEFGSRLGTSFIQLLQMIKSSGSSPDTDSLLEMAHRLLRDLDEIPLTNDEDPGKELRLSQIESKIKVLTVNFTKKLKKSLNNFNDGTINNKTVKKEDLSF